MLHTKKRPPGGGGQNADLIGRRTGLAAGFSGAGATWGT